MLKEISNRYASSNPALEVEDQEPAKMQEVQSAYKVKIDARIGFAIMKKGSRSAKDSPEKTNNKSGVQSMGEADGLNGDNNNDD